MINRARCWTRLTGQKPNSATSSETWPSSCAWADRDSLLRGSPDPRPQSTDRFDGAVYLPQQRAQLPAALIHISPSLASPHISRSVVGIRFVYLIQKRSPNDPKGIRKDLHRTAPRRAWAIGLVSDHSCVESQAVASDGETGRGRLRASGIGRSPRQASPRLGGGGHRVHRGERGRRWGALPQATSFQEGWGPKMIAGSCGSGRAHSNRQWSGSEGKHRRALVRLKQIYMSKINRLESQSFFDRIAGIRRP